MGKVTIVQVLILLKTSIASTQELNPIPIWGSGHKTSPSDDWLLVKTPFFVEGVLMCWLSKDGREEGNVWPLLLGIIIGSLQSHLQ